MVESHSHHAEAGQHDKAAGRPVIVLTRISPSASHFDQLKKVADEWQAFVKPIEGYEGLDVVCCVPEQVVWIEHWRTKADLDAFNRDHLAFSNYLADLFAYSRNVPQREVYRKLL